MTDAQLADLEAQRVRERAADHDAGQLRRRRHRLAGLAEQLVDHGPIARLVVECKAELEKIREQVQNIE